MKISFPGLTIKPRANLPLITKIQMVASVFCYDCPCPQTIMFYPLIYGKKQSFYYFLPCMFSGHITRKRFGAWFFVLFWRESPFCHTLRDLSRSRAHRKQFLNAVCKVLYAGNKIYLTRKTSFNINSKDISILIRLGVGGNIITGGITWVQAKQVVNLVI